MLPFSYTESKEPLVLGICLKDLVVFMKELGAWSKSLDFLRNLVMGETHSTNFRSSDQGVRNSSLILETVKTFS